MPRAQASSTLFASEVKPKGLLSFLYNAVYDPDTNQACHVTTAGPAKFFGLSQKAADAITALQTNGSPANNLLQPVINFLVPELQANLAVLTHKPVANSSTAYTSQVQPKGLLPFLYNAVYDPDTNRSFLADPTGTMNFFTLTSDEQTAAQAVLQAAQNKLPVPEQLLQTLLNLLLTELTTDYSIIW